MKGVYNMNNDEKTVIQQSQRYNRWLMQKLFYVVAKKSQRKWTVKRGEVFFVDLGENIGSEENKIRPVVVLQSNAYNFKSPVFTCAIISSSRMTIPDIQIPIIENYLYTDYKGISSKLCGTIDLGQIKTIGKERILGTKIATLKTEMNDIDEKLLNIFGLRDLINKKNNIISSLKGKIQYLSNYIDNNKK